jgi:hypothetical protein
MLETFHVKKLESDQKCMRQNLKVESTPGCLKMWIAMSELPSSGLRRRDCSSG